MQADEWMKHFVDTTEKRFDKIDSKLDEILRFKWRIAGGLALMSAMLTIGIQVLIK